MATAAAATAAIATLYSSLQEHLEIVSHLNSYAGYIKIAAAQKLFCNVSINVVVAGTAVFPLVPNPPLNSMHPVVRSILHMSFTTPPLPQTKFCTVRLTSGSKPILASPAILMQ